MKKLLPLIGLTLLGSCNSNTPKTTVNENSNVKEHKQMQMVYQFVGYLRNNDTKNALSMMQFKDSTSSFKDYRDYIERETIQIDSAQIVLHQNDIDDSTWRSDTHTVSGVTYLLIMANLKNKTGSPYSKSLLLFSFALVNSDTVLTFFDCALPK